MTRHKSLLRLMAVTSVISTLTLTLAAPALAATGRGELNKSFALGSATITTSPSRVDLSGQISVHDKRCHLIGSHGPDSGKIRVRFTDGYSNYYSKTNGKCDGYEVKNVSVPIRKGARISWWAFVLCNGLTAECFETAHITM